MYNIDNSVVKTRRGEAGLGGGGERKEAEGISVIAQQEHKRSFLFVFPYCIYFL